LHELWAVPLELGLALWILNREIGVAFIASAAIAILSTGAIMAISKYMANAQKVWIRGIQTRVDFTASMLGSMKV
jgi:ATP-binding cassette subfamily C (CFTR/MRP) protein 1